MLESKGDALCSSCQVLLGDIDICYSRGNGHGGHGSWDYDVPHHWSDSFADCSGAKQSPINIESGRVQQSRSRVAISEISNYRSHVPWMRIHNDGHSMQVAGHFGDLTLPDGKYKVRQFHFHFPSEHTVDGKYAAGEMHIVHQKEGSTGTADLAVVGILLDTDHALPRSLPSKQKQRARASQQMEMEFFQQLGFGNGTLPSKGGTVNVGKVNMTVWDRVLKGSAYHYQGSLTTPPCSETVHWYVMQRPAPVTAAMVDEFKAHFPAPMNNRPVQGLSGRVVTNAASLPGEFRR